MTRKSTHARKMAAKRKQETPEQREARLESMRLYAQRARQNESKSKREERLKIMRCYARRIREHRKGVTRRQNAAMIIERVKQAQEADEMEEFEPISFVTVEMTAE